MERQSTTDTERLEQLQAELRQHQMADQMRELQGPKHESRETEDAPVDESQPASTPFIKEMSMDAQKTISRIMGVAQLLKHKPGAKEQAQLVQQLTANARRLDNTVRTSPTSIPSSPAPISLELRNTDLDP